MFITQKRLKRIIDKEIEEKAKEIEVSIKHDFDSSVDKKIREAFEKWGFKREKTSQWLTYPSSPYYFLKISAEKTSVPYQYIEDKLNLLIEHLGLEYHRDKRKFTDKVKGSHHSTKKRSHHKN